MKSEFFWEGFDAGVDFDYGLLLSRPTNPYEPGTVEYDDWLDGYHFSEGEN